MEANMNTKREKRRYRSPNWLPSEKILLVDLVEQHFSILESKGTDAVTMREKNSEWERVAQEYNSMSGFTPRSADNLKAAWENTKKVAKKDFASQRMEMFKTGGGLPKPKKEDAVNNRVIQLIKPAAVGHVNPGIVLNPYDGDAVALQSLEAGNHETSDMNVVDTVEHVEEILMNPIVELLNGDWTSCSSQMLKTPLATPLRQEPIVLAEVPLEQAPGSSDEPTPVRFKESKLPNTPQEDQHTAYSYSERWWQSGGEHEQNCCD